MRDATVTCHLPGWRESDPHVRWSIWLDPDGSGASLWRWRSAYITADGEDDPFAWRFLRGACLTKDEARAECAEAVAEMIERLRERLRSGPLDLEIESGEARP